MKFSITIPTYKTEFLQECIESALNQTYDDYEVVILNDFSPQNVEDVVKSFSNHVNFNKIRYYENEKNVGAIDVVDNWNKLLHLAKGEFVICMGDDDKLASDCLEQYNKLISNYPTLDVYHARTMMIDEKSMFCDLQEERPEWQSVYSLIWHYTFKEGIQFVGDFLYRTDALRANGGFYKLPLAWGSDCVTSFIAAKTTGVANTIKPIFYYRHNRRSITNSCDIRIKMQATIQYSEWMLEFLKDEPQNKMDCKYWHLIKEGFATKIQHHETIMIGNDIKTHFLSGIWYWVKNKKKYRISVKQILLATGIGLALKFI